MLWSHYVQPSIYLTYSLTAFLPPDTPLRVTGNCCSQKAGQARVYLTVRVDGHFEGPEKNTLHDTYSPQTSCSRRCTNVCSCSNGIQLSYTYTWFSILSRYYSRTSLILYTNTVVSNWYTLIYKKHDVSVSGDQ